MTKLVTFLMASIIIRFLQVNCTVFSQFEYVRFMNMYNSTFITYVALVKVVCHQSVICHAFVTNCRNLKSMDVTFCGTAFVSVVLKIAELILKLKHTHVHTYIHTQTHTHTHTHMYTPYAACRLFTTLKIGRYDENEIQFALCY